MSLAALSRSEWISLGAVLIAGGALILALFALVLALRADARAARAEKPNQPGGSPGPEQDTGAETMGAVAPPADLQWKTGAWAKDGDGRRVYTMLVRNVGRGQAEDVRVWVEDENEQEVSTPVREPASLEANCTWTRVETRIDIDQVRPELRFAVGWRDGEDHHRIRTELGLPS